MDDAIIRQHLVELLQGGSAHTTLDDALKSLPQNLRGAKTDLIPYSVWELVEHMRIAQWDIVEFSRNSSHVSPDWPEGYWPSESAPKNENIWNASLDAIQRDLQDMSDLIRDPKSDLFKPFPYGTGQTLMREAMLLADHNSYHLGQIVLIRKLLGAWR